MRVRNSLILVISFFQVVTVFQVLQAGIFTHTLVYASSPQYIVASVIAAEACGEGERAMRAVANTIKNRAKQKDITPLEVVTAPSQYAGLHNKNKELRYQECKEVVDRLADTLMDLNDITKGALYFKTPDERLRPWHKELTLVVGKLEFYR